MAGSRRWSPEQNARLYDAALSYWPRSGLNPGLWQTYRDRLEPQYPSDLVGEALRQIRQEQERDSFPTLPAVALWCKDVTEKFRKQMRKPDPPPVSPQEVAANEDFWRDRLSGPNSAFYLKLRERLRQGAAVFDTLWQ